MGPYNFLCAFVDGGIAMAFNSYPVLQVGKSC